MRLTLQSLFLLPLFVATVHAQVFLKAARKGESGRAALPADSVSFSIAHAEARAGKLPPAGPGDTIRANETPLAGTTERRCIEVGAVSTSRSGDIGVSGFAVYQDDWHQGLGQLDWNLFTGRASVPDKLRIRASRLDAPADARVFELPLNAYPKGGLAFYSSPMHLPSTGLWMFVVTGGGYWGCFVYELE